MSGYFYNKVYENKFTSFYSLFRLLGNMLIKLIYIYKFTLVTSDNDTSRIQQMGECACSECACSEKRRPRKLELRENLTFYV